MTNPSSPPQHDLDAATSTAATMGPDATRAHLRVDVVARGVSEVQALAEDSDRRRHPSATVMAVASASCDPLRPAEIDQL
mgnify:FL=1